MQPHAAERRHLERQIAYARPIFMVLALVDLLDRPPSERGPHAVLFVTCLSGGVAASGAGRKTCHWIGEVPLPLSVDLAALAVFLVLTRSVVAFWFVYLFVALASGIRWGTRRSIILAGDRHSCLADSNGHERPAGLGTDDFLDRSFHRDVCRGGGHVLSRQPPAAPRHRAGVSGAAHGAARSGPRHGGIPSAGPGRAGSRL